MNEQPFLWPLVEQIPPLPLEHVHVWAWNLDVPPRPRDWGILCEEETLRARRFVFPRDRDRYVQSHSLMRKLLGSYAGVVPAAISYSSNAHGKPQLQPASDGEPIYFNLTHSAGIAALAVSRSYKLGIDIEMIRPIEREIAENYFSSHELCTLQSLPPGEWLAGFYRCWTSKEALLKGEGLGLNLPLDAFDVEVDPQRAPALLASRLTAILASAWQLIKLRPLVGAVGTLAVRDDTGKFSADVVRFFSLNA
jgi:4'-phosphopantetheinyl transferase